MRIIKNETGCWVWQGADTGDSDYGCIVLNGQKSLVHRVMFVLFHGAIPEGMEIDHLCRNHRCCNPEHLEAVTRRENILRGFYGDLKTHCARGHPWNVENTVWSVQPKLPAGGRRVCRICRRENARAQQDRIRSDPEAMERERARKRASEVNRRAQRRGRVVA